MKAIVKRIDGLSLIGKSDSNHWVPMDVGESVGGADAASTPLQLVLIGLGGCTSIDVLSILAKKRVNIDDFTLEVEAERAAEHPKVFTKIVLKFTFFGKNISSQAVERAIELSVTKYCSVLEMLSKTANIETEYEIKEK